MRMLIDVNFPLEPFNTLVRNGTAGHKIQQILEDIKPEAVYFSERNTDRGCCRPIQGSGHSGTVFPHIRCKRGVSHRYGTRRIGEVWPRRAGKEVWLATGLGDC